MVKYIDLLVICILVIIGIFYEQLSPSYAMENNGVYYDNVRSTNNVKLNNVDGLNIDYNAELEAPGDYFELYFDVVNSYGYDVEVSDYFINENDNYVNYELTYSDGSDVREGDIIRTGETKGLVYKVLYKNLIHGDDYVFDTNFSINFEQAV